MPSPNKDQTRENWGRPFKISVGFRSNIQAGLCPTKQAEQAEQKINCGDEKSVAEIQALILLFLTLMNFALDRAGW